MRYAQIIDGIVANVIIWDGQTDLDLEGELVNVEDIACGPGWTYDGATFTAPPAIDPDDDTP